MKVTHVSIRPTQAADDAGRAALTPELLAATGARYSRSNDGLDAILAKIDPENADASVDRIFKFVDYGHASIADMAPVALFIDDITLWMAYYLWTICPTAGGQESSTRYIRLDADGLATADELGIPEEKQAAWQDRMTGLFSAYESALSFWENVALRQPEQMRLPMELINDPSEKAQKTVARMRRNFAFDRARYFLPVAAKTNVMLVMSARAWVSLCQYLLSANTKEATALGTAIKSELALSAPRLIRHARSMASYIVGSIEEFADAAAMAISHPQTTITGVAEPTPFLDILLPMEPQRQTMRFDLALEHHENRYAYVGADIRRTAVRFGWDAVAFAEIRDLNRHRTGTKYCPTVPVGFYHAEEQLSGDANRADLPQAVGIEATQAGLDNLRQGDSTYIYHLPLGAQFYFEHTTTADKFIYEAELRTGTGSHFRYARHLHDALILWYEKFPETRGLILEGSAEPE